MKYIEDIEGFWQRHKKAKAALHKWSLSSMGKKEIQQRLTVDVEALKNGRILKSHGEKEDNYTEG